MFEPGPNFFNKFEHLNSDDIKEKKYTNVELPNNFMIRDLNNKYVIPIVIYDNNDINN